MVKSGTLHGAIMDLARRHSLTAYGFSTRTGISVAYSQQLFGGGKRTVGHEIAFRIADAFGESRLKWLNLAGYDELAEAIAHAFQLERAPLLATVPGGPEGGTLFDEPEDELVPIGFLRTADIALRIVGESMSPKYPPGSVVAVKLTKRVPDAGPVVVLLPSGEHTIKRWQDTPDGPRLVSDNPDQKKYPPLDPAQAQIVGVPVRVYMPQQWEAD